ncbi:MAG: hypothetical protein ACRDVG_08825, partial [Jatrophihabitantaceae bacterium]
PRGAPMLTSLRTAVLCAALVGASGAALSARAADPDFCRDYARTAVNQYRQAEDHHRCMERMHDFTRWSDDWRRHYDWCVGVSRDRAWDERRLREHVLDDCAHHGWDHDHDRGDHDRSDHDRYDHDRYDHDRYDH